MTEKQINEIFSGKVVSFDLIQQDATFSLKEISAYKLNNRIFISGKIPKAATVNDWAEGLTGSIAWESIINFVIFDSEKDYIKRLELSDT